MPSILNEEREYQRIRHSSEEKTILAGNGLQHVLSSNVSAIGQNNNSLIVRFHNGTLYEYPGKSDLYENILKSNSKGHQVYIKLVKPNASFNKIGSLPLPSDVEIDDDQLLQELDKAVNRITSQMKDQTQTAEISDTAIFGLTLKKIIIGGIAIFTLI